MGGADTHEMIDEDRTKAQLIDELVRLRQRIAELEASETEGKRAEEGLRREAERWQHTFNAFEDVVLIIDKDFRVVRANQATYKAFAGARVVGVHCYELFHDTEGPIPDCPSPEVFSSGEATRRELCEQYLGGRWFDINACPIKGQDGTVQEIVHVVSDITGRKRAEEGLRQSEQRYRLLADNIVDAVWTVDLSMRPTYMSPSITGLLGYGVEEAMAKPMHEVFAPASFELAMGVLEEEMAKEKMGQGSPDRSRTLELELDHKDGSIVEVETSFRFIRDADGNPTEILAVARDISGRKLAEKMLRQSEENYRSIFENSGTATLIVDKDDTIVLANSMFARLSGWPREEVEGRKRWMEFAASEDLKRLLKYGRRRRRDPAAVPRKYEARFVNRKGEIRRVLVTADLIPGTKRSVASLLDVTEWREADVQLRRSHDELRSLYRHLQSAREDERRSIAREIHDELGQTLTALKMDVAWLNKRLPQDMKPLLDKTRAISDSIDEVLRTVKRVSAELRPQVLDDLGLPAAVEWQAKEFQERTGIKCELAVVPDDITVDREVGTAVFRILQEALTNVARHADATKVRVSLRQRGGRLVLRIEDDGKGIGPEQVLSPISFGLMGIRERASSHGGKVKITGSPGKGTLLTVSIAATRRGKADDKNTGC